MRYPFRFFFNLLSFFFLINISIAGAATYKNGESIFDEEKIHEIRISFSQPHFWDSLLSHYSSSHELMNDNGKPVMANTSIDGVAVDSIGIDLKGYFSYSIPTDKKSIKLKINAFVKKKDFQGLHRLNLSNEFPDPSMLRSVVAFKVLRENGALAPRTSFAKVYINDKYYGLYVIIEQIDKEFLENYFKTVNGDLIKPQSTYLFWFKEDDKNEFAKNYEIKSKNISASNDSLFSFAEKLNTTPAEDFYDSLKNNFDFESYLPVLAADIILNNWDSYFYGTNYWLYRNNSENKYYYLPWDYNTAFNNYEISGGDYAILPGGKSDRLFELPLTSKVVNNATLKKKYLNEIKKINQSFSEDSLKKYINHMHDLIRPALTSDTKKVFTMAEYENSLFQHVSISEIEYIGLLSFIRYRHEQVEQMILRAVK